MYANLAVDHADSHVVIGHPVTCTSHDVRIQVTQRNASLDTTQTPPARVSDWHVAVHNPTHAALTTTCAGNAHMPVPQLSLAPTIVTLAPGERVVLSP